MWNFSNPTCLYNKQESKIVHYVKNEKKTSIYYHTPWQVSLHIP